MARLEPTDFTRHRRDEHHRTAAKNRGRLHPVTCIPCVGGEDPDLLGGPFIDYPNQRVAEIGKLRDRTVRERGRMIELSEAVRKLDGLLRAEADGFSMESLYPRVPEILRGYVEL